MWVLTCTNTTEEGINWWCPSFAFQCPQLDINFMAPVGRETPPGLEPWSTR